MDVGERVTMDEYRARRPHLARVASPQMTRDPDADGSGVPRLDVNAVTGIQLDPSGWQDAGPSELLAAMFAAGARRSGVSDPMGLLLPARRRGMRPGRAAGDGYGRPSPVYPARSGSLTSHGCSRAAGAGPSAGRVCQRRPSRSAGPAAGRPGVLLGRSAGTGCPGSRYSGCAARPGSG
jgi:hypothetical protein